MSRLDETHDASATSWIESANEPLHDFPIQNLPFAEFRRKGTGEAFRGGIAIGDEIVDLSQFLQLEALTDPSRAALEACSKPTLNVFFDLGPFTWHALRQDLFALLHRDAATTRTPALIEAVRACLVRQCDAEFAVPVSIGDYTDFFTSIYHAQATAVLAAPGAQLPPNFRWIPTAYHGRASSVRVAGHEVRRPHGQVLEQGQSVPRFVPSQRLDYELELGAFIGRGNQLGERIAAGDAESHIFGLCLLNDWSARDIQAWEGAPLGPFQAKNFATTISPWIVTMEALAPYGLPWTRDEGEPEPLPHLDATSIREHGALDIELEVLIETERMRADGQPPFRLSRTNFKHQYWTLAQMIGHHAANGCNLVPGDLIGTGTISGPRHEEAGAMIELTYAGRQPVVLDNGEARGFLNDGDTLMTTGWCEKPGFRRIGFGRTSGTIVAAS